MAGTKKKHLVLKTIGIIFGILLGLFILIGVIAVNTTPGSPTKSREKEAQAIESQQPNLESRSQNLNTENLLMRASFIEAPVVNAMGKKIGTRAYITLSRELLLEVVSLDDVAEFYKSFQGKEYNWVSVICPEGTGLVFGGGGSMATYGKIDKFGRMDGDIHWTIIYDETLDTFRELEF
jgi:hypothetical protein